MRSLGLMTFMIPVGFSFAATLKIGHFVGENNKEGIKYYFATCMYLSIGVALLQIVLLLALEK